jgi:UDP-glucuronate 4-epimerase
MRNVLITGAAGFIGFHLAKYLDEKGDRVIGLDNFNSYYDPTLKEARKQELEKLGIPIHEADICDAEFLNELLEKNQITHLIHLAAQAGVRYSLTNPQAYIKANIEGFVNILEACRNHPSIKLVYASSSSVYGLNKKTPFSLEDRTDQQASLYGATKKTNELFASTYHHLFGISVTGLRFFTVYGPWGRPDMAYFQFTKAILNNEPIQIFNHGKMKRDFTYIDDIIEGIEGAMSADGKNEVFNLGNNRPENLLDMVNLLEKYLGKSANKVFVAMQPGDVLETYADISHSEEKLGYRPKTKLEDGLRAFVEWYQEYYN